MPTLLFENRHGRLHGKCVAGVDEAGRGPLAGPVVAAAVVIRASFPRALARRIDDSKALDAATREELFPLIQEHATFAICEASVAEIDALNILQASLLAMRRAIELLSPSCDVALIDGNIAPAISCAAVTLVGGDARSLSIAAASILAKVTRDKLMRQLHEAHPHYGWHRNAGYPTPQHIEALRRHGVTPHHRTSFAPVRRLLAAA